LALELSRGLPDAAEHRAEVLAIRQWLRAYGHPDAYAPGSATTTGWVWAGGAVAAGILAVLVAAAIRGLGGG